MEEDGSVKAPVTRLRRRFSVDQSDDTKSPSAPSTPTKKRGRLAAKPQLELIDENGPQNSPKRTTRRSMARDVVEEEKPLTPGRPSTRLKSNTSIVTETPQEEERSQTPSRRTTRIKSNTSIVSDTINIDSPRAMRAAARRNSQLGSDTETTVTPARAKRTRKDSTSSVDKQVSDTETTVTPARARRTRKDSTSSVDKQGTVTLAESAVTSMRTRKTRKDYSATDKKVDVTPSKSTSLVTITISEVPETNVAQSTSKADLDNIDRETSSPNNLRKSPRLNAKSNRNSKSERDDSSDGKLENDLNTQESNQNMKLEIQGPIGEVDGKIILSQSSNNLIEQLDSESKSNNLSHLNKSTSVIKDTKNSETKRRRTKSWTILSARPSSDSNFHSDNERTKNKLKKHEKQFSKFQVGSGDSALNKSKTEEIKAGNNGIGFNTLSKQRNILNKEADTDNKQIIEDSVTPDDSIKQNKSLRVTPEPSESINEGNEEKVLDEHSESNNSNVAEILFDKSPGEIKAVVFIEDSDSNSESNEKKAQEPTLEGDDQCVPVVYRPASHESESRSREITAQVNKQEFGALNNLQENIGVDDSCEPMEVDVTIPENVSVNDSKKSTEQQLSNNTPVKESNESLRKSLQIIPNELENTANTSHDKSKRKSSSQFFTQDLENSSNENKSTLILSQIKDVSNTNISASKSPKVLNEMSKSISVTDIAKQEVVNINLSVNYLTSTPVQQKDNVKPGLQMNTSIITPRNEGKEEIKATKERSEILVRLASRSSENDTSDENSENEVNEKSEDNYDILDSEAEDAGDNYESGDSQDEDEMQYEKENEILERGETLTSEEELSTDSDYEKDSFIVSSDEEDNELLSGSGDDLGVSDNELTMSTKSKKKYDERKKKEQKKASREMYEARHKLDKFREANSNILKPKKSNRLRLDSVLLESSEDNNMPPKKNKRMRLESTFETSDAKSDTEVLTENNESVVEAGDEEIGYKKKKSKRLSVCNVSVVNEKEITIGENATEETDPLLMQVKPEPKTPHKELDISTVHFTCIEKIEEVEVDENASVVKPIETMDPLQGMASLENSDRDDDSSMSENEEIAKNYDSVLNQLNKENKHKQTKSGDMSLNLNKKQKKSKESVIDELNLTVVKNKAKDESDKPNKKTIKRIFKKLSVNDDNSVDSTDLKLLFSDESNDIEKNGDSGNQTGSVDSFIPLKRTEAKTEVTSSIVADENTLKENLITKPKKKNKRKSQQTEEMVKECNSNDGDEIKFFIDTTGTRFDSDKSMNESLNTSKKKKNKSSTSFNAQTVKDGATNDSDSNDAPLEVSFKSEKIKEKAKRFSEILEEDENLLTRLLKTPASEKKKKNKLTESQKLKTLVPLEEDESGAVVEENTNTSFSKTPGTEKKKKKKFNSQDFESTILQENIVENQGSASLSRTPRSEKKKNRLSESETGNNVMTVETLDISVESAKKKKNTNIAKTRKGAPTAQVNDGTFEKVDIQKEPKETLKKRKRKSLSIQTNEDATQLPENSETLNSSSLDETVESKKKKRKISDNNEDNNIVADKKRKERDDDDCRNITKVLKRNCFDQIHVPRLPAAILSQLNDKPKKELLEMKTSKLVSTTNFVIEKTMKRKNKPSNFLEESVYLNTDDEGVEKKSNARAKKPKVLPYLPTVCTSYSGFTTNFQVTVLPKKFEFVAQSNETSNFKTTYLENKRKKKLRTHDLYKKRSNTKLTKY